VTTREELIEERKRRHWSQQEVADRIGTTPNNVSRWELGVTAPGPYFRGKLCDLFDKSAQDLGLDSYEDGKEQAPQSARHILAAQHAPFPPVWNIPYRRNLFFTGREAVLARLHALLNGGSGAALAQTQALCGLGGIGKTQTALEYASRYRESYQTVLWTRADTYELLLSELAAIAGLLQLPEADEQDQRKSVEAVKRWLNEQRRWLLILDNVEDVAMLSDVLPSGERGHVLLTMRSQITGTLVERIDLGLMEPEEGAFLLLRRAKLIALDVPWEQVPERLHSDARSVAELLGGLPLALDQAGAYLEETACRLSDYMDHYQSRRASLLARRGEPRTDHPESVTTTFTLLLEQIERIHPAAADLLRLCAFFHPDAIPEEIFTEHADALGPTLQPVAVDPLAWDATMNALRRFSLVQRDAETRTICIHRLIQAVIRESMDEHTQHQWGKRAIQALNHVFPDMDESSSWHQYVRYLPHAQSCSAFIAQWQLSSPEAARLLYQTARALHKSGHYTQAERFHEQALVMRQYTLGPDHHAVAQSLNALGILYFSLNRYRQAEPLFRRSLAILEQALGPAHPEVATCLNALGLLANFEDNYPKAEELLQRALTIREQAFGMHPLVAQSLGNLGSLYLDYGQYSQAEALLTRAQTLFERTLGPEHPDLVINLDSLAALSIKQGRYLQAESLCQRALALRDQHFGTENPHHADTLTLLADLSERRGEYGRAEHLCHRAVSLYEQANGREHPSLASTLTVQAKIYARRGEYGRAEHLCHRVLTIFEQSFGAEHSSMVATLNILGRFYERQENDERAESVVRRGLSIIERLAGSEHPEMGQGLTLLADLALKQGKPSQAGPLYRRALAILERTVGTEHPDLAQCLAGLAQLCQNQGEDAQADLFYRQALAMWEKTVGPDQPEVAICLERYKTLLKKNRGGSRVGDSKVQSGPRCATDTQQNTQLARGEVDGMPIAQRVMDPLALFLSEYCLFHPQAWCSARDLWQAYQDWTHESGERFPLSRRAFVRYVKAKGAVPDRTKTLRIWRGIALSNREREVTQGDAR
jgi:tetratricopeptide (TPR) repeat protein